jgi:small subunit ribosomal protein S8
MKKIIKVATTNDPIADFITRLRNGLSRKAAQVKMPYSKLKEKIAILLKAEGYINEIGKEEILNAPHLVINLRYHEGQPVINNLKRVSKPGRRVYSSVGKLPRVLAGHGIAVISTSRGLVTDHEARKRRLGGEILFTVW